MKADEIIRPEEENYLASVANSLGTADEDFDHLESMYWNKALTVFSKMSMEKKNIVIKICKEMAMVDNYYDRREKILIDKLLE